jgi:ubiquitin-conjugating enzyme E2 variant
VIIPRNFKLLDELEFMEKGNGDPFVSMGLVDPYDLFLSEWSASIIGPPGTVFDGNMYTLRVSVGDSYPETPPTVTFVTKVNLSCVDGSGHLKRDFPGLSHWNRNGTIESVLVAVKNCMNTPANRRSAQPAEGSTY